MSALHKYPRGVATVREAAGFMKNNVAQLEILTATRQRFEKIFEVLLEALINKHDQGHQFRTALSATRIMLGLGFDFRTIAQAVVGGLIHDVGYHEADDVEITYGRGYFDGHKKKFKKHALKGANEVEAVLKTLLAEAREQGDKNQTLVNFLSYKDEEGKSNLMDETDIERIIENILNHNDYGKDDEEYDPRKIKPGAWAIQLGDKMDHCKERVYKKHMVADAFIPGTSKYDQKGFHRIVPYCIQSYDFSINKEGGTMEWVYEVDLKAFKELMGADFKYDKQDYVRDFERAYTTNSEVAAEAAGLLLAKEGEELEEKKTMIIKLQFPDGTFEILKFARPERDVYKKEVAATRAKMHETITVEA